MEWVLRIIGILLAVALIFGLVFGIRAFVEYQKSKHDVTRMQITLTELSHERVKNEPGYTNGAYYVRYTYEVQNLAREEVDRLVIRTTVKDRDGQELGTIQTGFGALFGGTGSLNMVYGRKLTLKGERRETGSTVSALFAALYQGELEDFVFTHEVVGAYFDDGKSYDAED